MDNRPVVIAFANQKGGVGKTTTAFYVGIHLAQSGRRVLWVDLDPQANLTTLAQPLSNGQHQPQHVGHVLGGAMRPTATLRSAARPTEHGPQIVVSGLELTNVAAGLMARNLGRVEALRRAVDTEGFRWDYILVDCPPDAGVLALNAYVAADAVIIPCDPEPLAIDGLVQMASILADVEHATGRTIRRETVATKVDTRNAQHQRGLEQLQKGGAVVVIPRRNGANAGAELMAAYEPLAGRILAAGKGVQNA